MKVQVVGKKVGSFTKKETGEIINYGKLHCVGNFDLSDSGAEGQQCMIISCSPKYLDDIPVPCTADVQFNQYGRFAGFDIIES